MQAGASAALEAAGGAGPCGFCHLLRRRAGRAELPKGRADLPWVRRGGGLWPVPQGGRLLPSGDLRDCSKHHHLPTARAPSVPVPVPVPSGPRRVWGVVGGGGAGEGRDWVQCSAEGDSSESSWADLLVWSQEVAEVCVCARTRVSFWCFRPFQEAGVDPWTTLISTSASPHPTQCHWKRDLAHLSLVLINLCPRGCRWEGRMQCMCPAGLNYWGAGSWAWGSEAGGRAGSK